MVRPTIAAELDRASVFEDGFIKVAGHAALIPYHVTKIGMQYRKLLRSRCELDSGSVFGLGSIE